MASVDCVDSTPAATAAAEIKQYTLGQLIAYMLKLGTLGFGGPVALVGYMHRDLVERRSWLSEADYKEGLTLAQLMPGPLAAQLAIYLGYVHYRVLGATLVGIAFVIPSFLMVVALGWAYVHFGGLPWMQAIFYGIGPAVIAIICLSAYKLTRKSIGKSRLLWLIYLISASVTVVFETEFVLFFLIAGVLYWAVKTRNVRRSAAPTPFLAAIPLIATGTAGTSAGANVLVTMTLFFLKAGAFVFGSGLAIVPFLYGGVVKEYGWLSEQQFLDAVAVAMVTPGPVVITVGFIGYIVAGLSGAILAAVATFLPCYFLTIVPAPYFKKHGQRPGIVAFVEGVTAAAIGAIAGAAIVLGRRTILADYQPEWPKVVIFLVALAILLRFRKMPEPVLVAVAGLVGLLLYPWVR